MKNENFIDIGNNGNNNNDEGKENRDNGHSENRNGIDICIYSNGNNHDGGDDNGNGDNGTKTKKKPNRCRKLILKLLLKYVPLIYKTLIVQQKTGRNPGQYRGYIHLTFQQQKKMLSTTTVTTILFYSILLIDRITN